MSVASKNLFALLGNDADGDSEPAAPVKTVEKTSTHTAKRNTDGAAPSKAPVAGSRRGGGLSGNEAAAADPYAPAAFRDRNAGSDRNRGKPSDEAPRGGPRGGSGARGRGGRGARHSRPADERHSKSAPSGGSDKTAAQAWGATEGTAELKDEQAGEEQAQAEQKEAAEETIEEKEEEPEDKSISYADYIAQQAEKKAALEAEAALRLRKANEGIKDNKKWANAKPLTKDEDEDYFAGTGGKAKRERERKVKQVVEIDQRYVEPAHTGGRGGRGGPRGGARGGDRGGRGRGAPRGEFRGGRGGDRGGRSDAPRAANLNPTDESAFPSLGSNKQ
ncbi:hypothetical protein V8F33_006553 [Rhypophila sp. PSN 637]